MDEPTTYLTHPTTTTATTSHHLPPQRPTHSSSTTTTMVHKTSSKDAEVAVGARLIESNSGDKIIKSVGRDQDTNDIDGSAQQIQATAKVTEVPAELESVLKSVISRPPSSSSLKDTTNTTATTMATTVAGAGVGVGRYEEQLVESPQIVRSASLRTRTFLSPVQQGLIQAAPVPVVEVPVEKAQKVVKDAQKSQPQVQQKHQQAQTTPLSVLTITSTTGGGYSYSPPRQHIYYSHTPHSHTQHHHHHRLHHHHQYHHNHQHHQQGSSTGYNGGGSSEKQKKNRRFSYSKVGAAPSPATPQDSKGNINSTAGPGLVATGGGLNRTIGAVGDSNGSLGLLVDPTPKCCKVRALHPQLSVTTSPMPSPSHSPSPTSPSSRAFASMPSTASPETAGLSPASAAVVAHTKDASSGSKSGSSNTSAFDSSSAPSSSSSSMTSVSPSSITEHSHSYSSGKDHSTVPDELRGSDQQRQEKEMGKKVDSIGSDGSSGEGHVTGSLATQQQPSSQQHLQHQQRQYRAQSSSDAYTCQQQDHIIQQDSLGLGEQHQQKPQNPLELYREALPPTSTDLHHLQHQKEHDHDHDHDLPLLPRVCKMVVKHPFVKLDWKVPEPIKAGGEMLRGVLIITAKEWQDSEAKAAIKGGEKKGKKMKLKQDRYVWVDHIEVDLTGLEEVTTGAGLLSRTRTDRHCFLHKTQVLPIEELKCILDTSSSSSTTTTSHTATNTSSQSGNGTQSTSTCASIPNRTSSLDHSSSSLTDAVLAQPGQLAPGTQHGISFQMRIPERVGGTYRNAHASISYQLTANVHIRRGKEMFVLQHPLPLSLFELVQVRAATKITSPHDINPSSSSSNASRTMTGTSASSSSFASSSTTGSPSSIAIARRQAGVRFVIPKANSVLGTAAVKPYSLWGLGPATSSSSSSHYGHHSGGHGYRRQSHQRRGSLSVPNGPSASSASASTGGNRGASGSGMTRSYSDIGALSSQLHSKDESSSSPSSSSSNATTSLKKARFDPDEMLSAEDQYRSRQKQQQQELELHHQQQGSRPKLGPRKDSSDGLDEVGFGAHIDKSVAAAGENVTMDMFVVKSDMMKVVDIKVSLVETIQIFSLLENENSCAVVSPIAARTHIFDQQHQHQHQHTGTAGSPKRKLVETHMVKIAKAYVPAQAEESHANDNHLKGYYEDYEDARTTKSLSMYKLGMRIPESALTIQDRDLFKVDYMFVIKFFFKGRMGAFLELPIEIVSQYNHNRISTISGAISCVSNSVRIALPPVPILIKRHDGGGASTATVSSGMNKDVATVEGAGDVGDDAAGQGIAPSPKYSPEDNDNEHVEEEGAGEVVSGSQGAEEIQGSSASHQNVNYDAVNPSAPSTNKSVASQGSDLTVQDASATIERSATIGAGPEGAENAPDIKGKAEADSATDVGTLKAEEDGILASSRLSKAEFEACTSRQVGLAVARYNSMSSTTGKTGTSSHVTTPAASIKDIKRTKPTPTIADGVPKIVIETFKQPNSGSHGPASSSTTSTSTSGSSSSTMSTTKTTTVILPALPILFDLTSAALPTPAPSTVSPPIPTPLVIPRTLDGPAAATTTTVMTPRLRSSSMGANGATGAVSTLPMADTIAHSHSFPPSVKDTELQLPKLQLLRQGTNTSAYSVSSREDDHHHKHQSHGHHHGQHLETEGTKSGSIVAKIAKSLSSPLLRSRTGSVSPNGSQANLAIVSPQQQSSAFTLAATTLSALTLLSAVGQAAVSSEGKKIPPSPSPVSQLPARPLKSCIKKRPTTTRPPGLNTGNLNVTGGGHQGRAVGLSSATPVQQGQQHPYSTTNTSRKKVTFAKGLTPVPSPTGSQVMLSEPIMLEPFKYKNNYPSSSASPSSSTSTTGTGTLLVPGLATPVRTNPAVAAASTPMTTTQPLVSTLNQQHHLPPPQQQWQQRTVADSPSSPHSTTASPAPSITGHPVPVKPGMSTKSPNSASPRARMHHPFDSHPSRLSPLEKKHLDFQIQVLKSSRNHGSATKGAVSFKGAISSSDDEEEEEGEEYGEGEEEGEEEEEEEEEEDDQETEEERIERRRQVRIAWLAKYGDAFKQVYGAVPELPPL